MSVTAEPVTELHHLTLDALRDQAQQLAEMAGRLFEQERTTTVAPSGTGEHQAATTESVAAHIVHQAGHRSVIAQSSYSAGPYEYGDLLLNKLHAQLLARGSEVRMILPSRLLGDEEAFEQLCELSHLGAEIRLSPHELPTATVFDGRLALLDGAGGRSQGMAVVRDLDTAKAMAVLHNAVWDAAVDLTAVGGGWTEGENALRVLRTLSQGHTDEVAARDLGLSVRTYRRHIASLMNRLEATSRFQAGVRAAQLGLIDPAEQ
ncbi:helix-turn-helix transcriptional regulator [Streptomyces sp. NBC_00249]|uniref:helix-turn-helix transcriptional regulator n=1 Tax=Streptomyces sp. NBC_00249 TaxID=2975690 RepID=UPI00225AAE79|nr:helix-turn-helix transcriptional regulator [Streptomyces sp. NBC_00249]MCX5193080.1 helix-turn-helix transcriptional regulator [Streptomyces sp. NBC_00249]